MLRTAARMVAPATLAAAAAWGGASAAAAEDEDLFIVKTALSPKAFKDFELVEKKVLTHNTARLRFALPAHHELGLSTASCLVARADIDGAGFRQHALQTQCPMLHMTPQARRWCVPTHLPLGSMTRASSTWW